MTKKILIVLPFSGQQFGAGLAVVNEQLTKALADNKHDVKLLTYQIHDSKMPDPKSHGIQKENVLVIQSQETQKFTNPGGQDGDKQRNCLYELINSKAVILGQEVNDLLKGWTPDYILGHSRFSGPAAILLRDNKFKDAKVGYFLHSYPPVEGMLLSGYEAFEEPVNVESSKKKLDEEVNWIRQADVVLAMGPLMRWGSTLMLAENKDVKPRVHEVISGVTPGEVSTPPSLEKGVTLLLSGRASAPVKGFQDIVVAALQLRNDQRDEKKKGELKRPVHIKVRGMNEVKFPSYKDLDKVNQTTHSARSVNSTTVQAWTNGVLGPEEEQTIKDKLSSPSQRVVIEVLPFASKEEVMKDYQDAHGILSAAYLEHFGIVPFEALGCGRPVLVSELSGSGQFLKSRYDELGQECVVEDFAENYPRPLTNAVLKSVTSDAFDRRPEAWEYAIFDLVTIIDKRIENARILKECLEQDYTVANFAQSVVAAFDSQWRGKITRQMAGGVIKEVPKEE